MTQATTASRSIPELTFPMHTTALHRVLNSTRPPSRRVSNVRPRAFRMPQPRRVQTARGANARSTRGALFLVGGKDGRNEDRMLIDRFARLSGGKSAHVLVVTTASDSPERHHREYSEAFHAAGVG